MHKAGYQQHGFTIVELLVVIVVIGILAAITIVSYTGISQRAIVATLQSDLGNSAQKLKMYQAEHGAYPQSLDGSNCPTGPADINYCLRPSSGNTFAYSSSSPYSSFSLVATNTNGTSYRITDGSGPVAYVPIVVTGGTVTTDGAYTVRTFTSSGTLTVTGGTISGAQVLVVAGGGGGGGGSPDTDAFGNGGNAGQYLEGTQDLTGTMGVTVGNGGGGGGWNGSGGNGTASVFGTRTASGGGGVGHTTGAGAGVSGSGAGGAGGFNVPGGVGLYSDITGTSVGRAGGGAAAWKTASEGGGGSGASGTANTGGGGGGLKEYGTAGAGGSGIVIIRYLTP